MSNETSAVDAYLGRSSAPAATAVETQQITPQSPQGGDEVDNELEQPQATQELQPQQAQPTESDDDIIFDDEQPTETLPQDSIYSVLSQELGFEVKNPATIKAKIEEIENTYKSKLEQAPKFANERVKEINEFALKGGKVADLEAIDNDINSIEANIESIKQVDPIEAWKAHYMEDMGLSADEVEILLENKGEIAAKVEGKTLIKQWENNLASQKQLKQDERVRMREAQEAKYAALTNGIKESLAKKTSLYSVKLSENDIAKVSKLADTPLRAIEQFFPYDEQGNPVVEVWAENFAKLTLGDSKAQTLFKKAKSDGARQVISERANATSDRQPTVLRGNQTVSKEQMATSQYLKTF